MLRSSDKADLKQLAHLSWKIENDIPKKGENSSSAEKHSVGRTCEDRLVELKLMLMKYMTLGSVTQINQTNVIQNKFLY